MRVGLHMARIGEVGHSLILGTFVTNTIDTALRHHLHLRQQTAPIITFCYYETSLHLN